MDAGKHTYAEVYRDEYTQECVRVKGGTVVVINMTAWSFLALRSTDLNMLI